VDNTQVISALASSRSNLIITPGTGMPCLVFLETSYLAHLQENGKKTRADWVAITQNDLREIVS
jgi:hypothetical protein